MKQALYTGLTSLVISAGMAFAADAPPPPPYATSLAQLDKKLTAECKAGNFSGVVVARKAGKIVYKHICGMADVSSHKPITFDTRFKIFSVSKSFTGTLVMMLADRHLIGLDDLARKYIPEMPEEWNAITIRQLLNHTNGIPDLTEKLLKAYQANPDGKWDGAMHEVLANLSADDKKIVGTPGAKFVYNNFGYELLALLIENVTHRSYEQTITSELFEPAHMKSAEISKPDIEDSKLVGSLASSGLAQGYNGKPGALEPANSFQFVQMGAGAIYASAQDMLNFDSALSSGKLVSPAVAKDCVTNAFVLFPEPDSVSYGCGWMNREVGNEKYFQHDGGNNGFQADFARDPRKGVAVVVLENLGFGYPLEANVRHSLMDILLK